MKGILLGTLALILIITLASWATETRVTTLGEANNIVQDEANIFMYPSTILGYRNLVLGEVDRRYDEVTVTELYRIGGHYSLGEDKGVVGLYLDKRPHPIGIPSYRPNINGDGIDHRITLFYGHPFGEVDFGLGLILYRDSYSVEQSLSSDTNVVWDWAEDTEESNSGMTFILGTSMVEKKLDAAFMLDLNTWTYTDTGGNDITTPEGNTSFGFFGRYWYDLNDEVVFVPHLSVQMLSVGWEDPRNTANKVKRSIKTTDIDFGMGLNIRPRENILLIGDLGVNFTPSKSEWDSSAVDRTYEEKTTTRKLPYFRIGLEAYVTKWWDIRLGATKSWMGSKTEYRSNYPWPGADRVVSTGYATTSTYLGSGFHFGNLTFDIWVEPDFLLYGPNFVSGYSGRIASMASIKYNW